MRRCTRLTMFRHTRPPYSNYKRKLKSNKYPGDIEMFYLAVQRTARILDRVSDYAMATGEQHLLRYRNAQKF